MTELVSVSRTRANLSTRSIRRILTAAAMITSLAACGSSPSAESPPTAADTTSASGASSSVGDGAAAVPELLQFEAPLVSGGKFTGADYAGRATAFWFWAPT